jgi:hypothetical protein
LNGEFVDPNAFIDTNDLTEDELDEIASMKVKDEKTFTSGTASVGVLKRII